MSQTFWIRHAQQLAVAAAVMARLTAWAERRTPLHELL
jgi:hypothetical protein